MKRSKKFLPNLLFAYISSRWAVELRDSTDGKKFAGLLEVVLFQCPEYV